MVAVPLMVCTLVWYLSVSTPSAELWTDTAADGTAARPPPTVLVAVAPAAQQSIPQKAPPVQAVPVVQPVQVPLPTSLRSHDDHNRNDCDAVAGDRVIRDWQESEHEVCRDPQSGIRIREYVQRSFEYQPQIYLYENVDVEYFNGEFLPNPCPTTTAFQGERGLDRVGWAQGDRVRDEFMRRNVRLISDRTVIRIRRFDVYNIYEAFHGYINTYFLIRVLKLNQSEIQFAFTEDHLGDSDRDAEWWNSMNGGRFPIIYTKNHGQRNYGMVDGVPYRIKSMVRSSSTGTSILTSNYGVLRGRSNNYHCKSSAFREATAWMRSNFANRISFSLSRPHIDGRTVVLWSSRRPYQRDFHYNGVPRQLEREDEFIQRLQQVLGAANYAVANVDFGSMAPHKAVEVTSNADVIVGIHGAGLTWASFLPRHGGLVEVFCCDRGDGNRHYHNLAKLADIHYRSTNFGHMARWNDHNVIEIAQLIKAMPLNRADAEP